MRINSLPLCSCFQIRKQIATKILRLKVSKCREFANLSCNSHSNLSFCPYCSITKLASPSEITGGTQDIHKEEEMLCDQNTAKAKNSDLTSGNCTVCENSSQPYSLQQTTQQFTRMQVV